MPTSRFSGVYSTSLIEVASFRPGTFLNRDAEGHKSSVSFLPTCILKRYSLNTLDSSALAKCSAMQRWSPNPKPSGSSLGHLRRMLNLSAFSKMSSSRLADWFDAMMPWPALMSCGRHSQ